MERANEFDRPMFKRLAHNDTGQAVGHQSGILIPKALDRYFPQLGQTATPLAPAPRVSVTVAMFDGDQFLGQVESFYQYQTWGGTRSPERRLTSGLSPLLNKAGAEDLLLIERGLIETDQYRLRLLRKGTARYDKFLQFTGTRRYGAVFVQDPPVSEPEISQALVQQEQREDSPFQLFERGAALIMSHSKRVARSRAFQKRLYDLYAGDCAFCGTSFRRLDGRSEAEAAHIVPRGLKGADDARNGLLLCKAHHWAFDNGLIGVGPNRRLVVPDNVLHATSNQALAPLRGHALRPPSNAAMSPRDEAFQWHTLNVLGR